MATQCRLDRLVSSVARECVLSELLGDPGKTTKVAGRHFPGQISGERTNPSRDALILCYPRSDSNRDSNRSGWMRTNRDAYGSRVLTSDPARTDTD